MPAILGGLGPAIYGYTRGFESGEESRQRGQAFESDQAIRRERLEQEQEMRPLRMRTLEGALDEQELNRGILKLKKGDQEKVSAELQDTLGKRKVFSKGIAESLASGDWNHFGRALSEIYPDIYTNAEAVRNEDGSITLSHGEGEDRKSKTVRGANRNKDTGKLEPATEGVGRDVSPDDELGMMAPRMLDPLGHFQKKLEEQYGLERIAATGEWRVKVAEKRAETAEAKATAAADQKAERDLETFYNRQNQRLGGLMKSEFETPTLTGMVPGYTQQMNDTQLRGRFQAMVEEELEEAQNAGKKLTVGKAVEQAKSKVKTQYDSAYQAALTNAQKLGPKVNWGNADQLTQMADNGDADARRLLQTINLVSKSFGSKVGQHMLKQIGAEQKRRGTQRARPQALARED